MMNLEDDVMKCAENIDNAGWSSMMLICIQGKTEDRIRGELCSYHLKKTIPFSDIGDMVLKIDEICDWLGTPQRTRELIRKICQANDVPYHHQ